MRKWGAAALVVMLASPALAASWTVDPAQSSLSFTGHQSDESFTGKFGEFHPDIDFSEAAPEKGHLHITIAMVSATVDGKDRADALPTKDWFNVAAFPTAEFTSTVIRRTGAHAYEATGMLSLHGVQKEIALPFTLSPSGTMTKAEGSVELSRNAFGIGTGQWASDQWIAYPVMVHYVIVASPAAGH